MVTVILLREDSGDLVTTGQHPLQHSVLLHAVTPGVPGDVHQQVISQVERDEGQEY